MIDESRHARRITNFMNSKKNKGNLKRKTEKNNEIFREIAKGNPLRKES